MDPTYATVIQDRVRSRVLVNARGCWLFQGSKLSNGYGQLFDGERKNAMAHRTSYRAFKGEIPAGFQVDHLCKTVACINPDHLEAVPPRVNNARSDSPTAINARKTHCIHGHPFDAASVRQDSRQGLRECRRCRELRNRARKWAVSP